MNQVLGVTTAAPAYVIAELLPPPAAKLPAPVVDLYDRAIHLTKSLGATIAAVDKKAQGRVTTRQWAQHPGIREHLVRAGWELMAAPFAVGAAYALGPEGLAWATGLAAACVMGSRFLRHLQPALERTPAWFGENELQEVLAAYEQAAPQDRQLMEQFLDDAMFRQPGAIGGIGPKTRDHVKPAFGVPGSDRPEAARAGELAVVVALIRDRQYGSVERVHRVLGEAPAHERVQIGRALLAHVTGDRETRDALKERDLAELERTAKQAAQGGTDPAWAQALSTHLSENARWYAPARETAR